MASRYWRKRSVVPANHARHSTWHSIGSNTDVQAYYDIIPEETVTFIFSEAFTKALETQSIKVAHRYGVLAKDAMEEFRRFFAIKAFAMDEDAVKISPTPLMDAMWHAAVLDTKFYSQLCSSLGFFVHHNPSGARDADKPQREKRLRTMEILYRTFFGRGLIGADEDGAGRDDGRDDGRLVDLPDDRMRIFIANTNGVGGKMAYTVSRKLNVKDLKFMIHGVEDVHVSDQRLIFGNQQLENDRNLDDYRIGPGNTIFLVRKFTVC